MSWTSYCHGVGIRLWAATYLLPVFEKDSLRVLKEISALNGIISFIAKNTISEWEKGNLEL